MGWGDGVNWIYGLVKLIWVLHDCKDDESQHMSLTMIIS